MTVEYLTDSKIHINSNSI